MTTSPEKPTTTTSGSKQSKPGTRLWHTIRIATYSTLGALALRLLHSTYRWKIAGALQHQDLDHSPQIFAFWHDSLLMLPGLRWQSSLRIGKERHVTILASRHGDGRIMAAAVHLLGMNSVAGSSTRGGAAGLLALVHAWRRGSHIAITPDGPRGPRHVSKPGALMLASSTTKTIYPIAVAAARYWQFRSWDRMSLPKPWSTIAAWIGDPITIPELESDEDYLTWCRTLDRHLETATAEATALLKNAVH